MPDEIIAEIGRLDRSGYSLLPLRGRDGKAPSARFKDRGPLPLHVVVDRMVAEGSTTFGIRLAGMLVVDVDCDTPEAREFVRENFGESSVQVRTSRGRHHFYRFAGKKPQSIRLPGISIDFKAGANEHVVSAGSIRRDGARYVPAVGRLESVAALPDFIDRRPKLAQVPADKIAAGRRNDELFARALEYARTVENYDQLLADLLQMRTIQLEAPSDFSDSEVEKIAKSVWRYRLENNLWQGRSSAVKIRRDIMDRLLRRDHGCDAFTLYTVLQSNHGHIPGRQFPIVPDAMRSAGLIPLCRNHTIRARDILIDEGLLIDCGQAGFSRAKRYQLSGGRGVPIT
ncbi:primase C-terminal domain-containing protein [Mesorhizobium sp.]|uniref:bifunctional DNA primase/polymerase n=1 Tax=Mesorhizobium sp. TaxID=1871066 RepID=UPI00257E6190|nr:primase C-terminal domain-containing protein [Mesorhizobium sp.]